MSDNLYQHNYAVDKRLMQYERAIQRIAAHVGACCGGVDVLDDNGLGSHTSEEIIRKIDERATGTKAEPNATEAAKSLWNSCGKELQQADDCLRSISSYLGQGGMWGTENLDYNEVEKRVKEGIDQIIKVETTRVALPHTASQVPEVEAEPVGKIVEDYIGDTTILVVKWGDGYQPGLGDKLYTKPQPQACKVPDDVYRALQTWSGAEPSQSVLTLAVDKWRTAATTETEVKK